MLVSYLTKHNARVTRNVSTNLIWATLVLALSVFTFGFETAVISSTQAMTRELEDHYRELST